MSLLRLAALAHLSAGHLQREFSRIAGLSPLQYGRRLRLLTAAHRLLSSTSSVQSVANGSGFASAEVLIRSFRAEFGCTPAQFRRGFPLPHRARIARGLRLARKAAPCFPFFRVSQGLQRTIAMPMLSVAVRDLPAQAALIIRSRIRRSAIAATLGESFGRIVPYALSAGGVFSGRPFARYPEFGPGLITLEAGMPLATSLPGEGDIESFSLPAGPAAVALHGGAYEEMPETYAALETWMRQDGYEPTGAPWEVYVNDPAEHPDPVDWRTEIYWPVRKR